jgi:hypothetical protein
MPLGWSIANGRLLVDLTTAAPRSPISPSESWGSGRIKAKRALGLSPNDPNLEADELKQAVDMSVHGKLVPVVPNRGRPAVWRPAHLGKQTLKKFSAAPNDPARATCCSCRMVEFYLIVTGMSIHVGSSQPVRA